MTLVLIWASRVPPSEPVPCGSPADGDAWLAGLGPASFAAACYCGAFIFWLSGRTRGGDPSRTTVAAVVAVLAAGGAWWAGGETVGLFLLWPVLALLLLVPSAILVPGLVLAMVLSPEPRAWTILRALAWWSGLVLLPGFVAVVGTWGGRLLLLATLAAWGRLANDRSRGRRPRSRTRASTACSRPTPSGSSSGCR